VAALDVPPGGRHAGHGGTSAAKCEARRRFLGPLLSHLDSAGLGQISEIADGDAPHTPRGCPFQAWSLGEVLRLIHGVLRLAEGDPLLVNQYSVIVVNPAKHPHVRRLRRPHDRPFVLYLSHKAVHPNLVQRPDGSLSDPTASQFLPAARHQHLYADAKIPRRPNALVERVEGKPALTRPIGNLPPLGRATGTSDAVIRGRLRTLMAAEEGIGQIFKALEDTQQLDRTLIIFTSDHGYFYGEHGLSVERRLAYEEGARIPLLIRYPPLIKAGTVLDPFVLSVDIAPTLLELAGAKAPPGLHGRSIVPLLKGEQSKLRDSFLIEYFSDTVFPRMDRMGYQAVRGSRWKYIHYTDLTGMDELYDLRADPYELRNRIHDPGAQPALREMQAEWRRLLRETS
jgi:N-acetylglucosamine-6-sulfatase